MGFHLHLLPLALVVVACTLTPTLVFIVCMIRVRSRRSTHNNPILFYVNGNSPVPASDDDVVGPSVVDHPIWLIRTVGLQQSIIDSITAFAYRKDEGLIDGTECSVCLGEFQEEESLRLLPKCSHAFHIACIDTWLASHTNCPLCRAPVVHDCGDSEGSAAEPDHRSNVSGENQSEESESEASIVIGSRDEEEEEGTEHVRRSVSVDSSPSASIMLREDVTPMTESKIREPRE